MFPQNSVTGNYFRNHKCEGHHFEIKLITLHDHILCEWNPFFIGLLLELLSYELLLL